jgi:CheY-like chemotaxis protein
MSAKRILVADDEPHMVHVLKLQLGRAGYEVRAVRDGRDALDAILAGVPDVLVTDVQMPRMTGEQLCAAIERQVPGRTFPIFVMTSMTDREHRRWTQGMRDTYFVEKPVSVRGLVATIERHFAAHSAPDGAPDV